MRKRSVILVACAAFGLLYLWPWAVLQKLQQLETAARATAPAGVTVIGQTSGEAVHLLFPVRGKGLEDIISHFGDLRAGGRRLHEGVDIRAPQGTAVIAVADGLVEKVKTGGDGGRQIWLLLDNGWKVYYAHLHTQLVQEGTRVKAGTLIGTVGNTGNARQAGPHLHFCLYSGPDRAVDPLPYLPGQLTLP